MEYIKSMADMITFFAMEFVGYYRRCDELLVLYKYLRKIRPKYKLL